MLRTIAILLGALLIAPLYSQEIFRLDFDSEFVPEEWTSSEKSEWGHVLGENGSNYFRFHPFAWRDVLQSPDLDLAEGHYTLYYSWNETGSGNPDFCNIRIREGVNYWNSIDRIGIGNHRTWQKDSTVIGFLPASTYGLEFEYKSLGHFPSQYLNLDNIYLVRRDVVTGINDLLTDLEFGIFPNPVTTQLNYRLHDQKNRSYDMHIFNSLGELVMSFGTIQAYNGISQGTIDVTELSAGIYSIQLSSNGRQSVTRFIIPY